MTCRQALTATETGTAIELLSRVVAMLTRLCSGEVGSPVLERELEPVVRLFGG